jgi:hypothetical protein
MYNGEPCTVQVKRTIGHMRKKESVQNDLEALENYAGGSSFFPLRLLENVLMCCSHSNGDLFL